MAEMQCLIWGTEAQLLDQGSGLYKMDSSRAGGEYIISSTASARVGSRNSTFKRMLTTWLCEQRRAGVSAPNIDESVLEYIKSRQKKPISARLTSGLLFLDREIARLGSYVLLGLEDKTKTRRTFRCMAETECDSAEELVSLFMLLRSTGYIETDGGADFESADIRPTAAGWSEIEKRRYPKTDSAQAFVAMWFDPKVDAAYADGIQPAIEQSGFKALRVDKKHHNNKIDDEIVAEIRRSRFVVADFTCEPEKARGGVYYEAGFAHGLGIPVIWTCRDDVMKYVHFDTRQYAHIVWKTPAELFEQLKNRIGATIGDGPLPKAKGH